MKFHVIGSNSAGNAYLLEAATETLLIEAGINFSIIKKALKFKISNVSAIVSHSHGDHSKFIKNVMNAGIPVYSGKETFEACGVADHHRAKVMEPWNNYKVGGFTIKPFPVNHDVPCFGFMIEHSEMGLAVFLTDTYFSDFTFPEVNQFIVECNHATDIMEAGDQHKFLRDRIIQSHMNLETCKDFLEANDLTAVNNIVLIHLSDRNADAKRFRREVQERTGKVVTIAQPGIIIENFNKTPF